MIDGLSSRSVSSKFTSGVAGGGIVRSGSWRGGAVTVHHAPSQLHKMLSMQEEIGEIVARGALEKGRRSRGSRSESLGSSGGESAVEDSSDVLIEAVLSSEDNNSQSDVLKKVPDAYNKKQSLDDLLKKFNSGSFQGGREELLDALKQIFGEGADSTVLYAALSYLEDSCSSLPVSSLLREISDGLMAQDGKNIHQGLLISETAAEFLHELGETFPGIRRFYSENIIEESSISKTFSKIVSQYGAARFGVALEFLMSGAVHELHVAQDRFGSSGVDPINLKHIIDDLHQLETLNTLNFRVSDVLHRLGKNFLLAYSLGNMGILEDLFKNLSNPMVVVVTQFMDLLHEVLAHEHEIQRHDRHKEGGSFFDEEEEEEEEEGNPSGKGRKKYLKSQFDSLLMGLLGEDMDHLGSKERSRVLWYLGGISFLREYRQIIFSVPLKIFSDDLDEAYRLRDFLLNVIQKAQDEIDTTFADVVDDLLSSVDEATFADLVS